MSHRTLRNVVVTSLLLSAWLAVDARFNAASAAWISATGKVEWISVYPSRDTILFALDSNGVAVAECSNSETFAIDGSISAERRLQLFSTLLAAKAAGATVSVAYLDVGGCVDWSSTSLDVYRGVTRLRF